MPDKHRLCASAELLNGGAAVLFKVRSGEQTWPAFVVRHNGSVVAYLNRCAHVPTEMDWMPGQFWDLSQRFIICSLHGAHYDPVSGICVMGPCRGKKLTRLQVDEHDGTVYWYPSETFHALN